MNRQFYLSRNDVVRLIRESGKEQEFIKGWGRSPEEYFEEHKYMEPDIWVYVLNDLKIEPPEP
jgi:hypothetical protein